MKFEITDFKSFEADGWACSLWVDNKPVCACSASPKINSISLSWKDRKTEDRVLRGAWKTFIATQPPLTQTYSDIMPFCADRAALILAHFVSHSVMEIDARMNP